MITRRLFAISGFLIADPTHALSGVLRSIVQVSLHLGIHHGINKTDGLLDMLAGCGDECAGAGQLKVPEQRFRKEAGQHQIRPSQAAARIPPKPRGRPEAMRRPCIAKRVPATKQMDCMTQTVLAPNNRRMPISQMPTKSGAAATCHSTAPTSHLSCLFKFNSLQFHAPRLLHRSLGQRPLLIYRDQCQRAVFIRVEKIHCIFRFFAAVGIVNTVAALGIRGGDSNQLFRLSSFLDTMKQGFCQAS